MERLLVLCLLVTVLGVTTAQNLEQRVSQLEVEYRRTVDDWNKNGQALQSALITVFQKAIDDINRVSPYT